MSKKKKDFMPKDFEDLLRIHYGNFDGSRFDGKIDYARKRKYGSAIKQIFSSQFEDIAKSIFSPFCNLEKIKENNKSNTFDFKNDACKLLLEVTTLDIDDSNESLERLDKSDVSLKLENVIGHILEKDHSHFPSYRKGGMVFYTMMFNFVTDFNRMLDNRFPIDTKLFCNNLDFLIFTPQPVAVVQAPSTDSSNSSNVCPTVFYLRNKTLYQELKECFKNTNYHLLIG